MRPPDQGYSDASSTVGSLSRQSEEWKRTRTNELSVSLIESEF